MPVLGAPLLHAPVLAADLLPAWRRPIARSWFGANKTWRGALFMTGGVVLAAALLSLWPAYWDALPDGIRDGGPWLYGLLLGLGVVLGELPNSFAKRRSGIAPGTQARGVRGAFFMVLDQGDLVLGAWVLLLPIWVMALWQAAVAFVVVSLVHLVTNVIGHRIGARTAPI